MAAINHGFADDDHQPVPFPVMETDNHQIFAQERGPEPFSVIMKLYDVSSSPWTHGSYSLKLMTEENKDMTMLVLDESQNQRLKEFISNNPDEPGIEPKNYAWSIPMCDFVNINVEPFDTTITSHVSFTTGQTRVSRISILSKPYYSILPTCASVDFNIFVDNLTETRGSSFRITAQSDLVQKSKDYRILFSRKPNEEPPTDQIVTGRQQSKPKVKLLKERQKKRKERLWSSVKGGSRHT